LSDGRIVPLSLGGTMKHKLQPYDVVLVHLDGKRDGRASLRVRPEVQGAAVVLENKTGRILAMTGGFSYPLSQLNRVIHAARQPGSTIKPLSYLAALGRGVQPNTLVLDEPITLPPIGRKPASDQDYWTPKNYGGGSAGAVTLRSALEHSRNLATVHLLQGGIKSKPEDSLNRLCELAAEAQIYRECVRFYPFVLGAQPVRPLDLAAFYSAIATEGIRPTPHVVESIARDGQVIYRHRQTASIVESVDQAAFYQLKTMLQGVVAHGTANAIADLAPYVAGKTGTSDDENDAWFVGFTNDVTVAIWIGYDNADGKRRTLGGGSTGGAVAVPIFESIIEAVWSNVAPKSVLAPPSPEAKHRLACTSTGRRSAFSECLRTNAKGKVLDTEDVLLSGKGVETDGRLTNHVRVQGNVADAKQESRADAHKRETQGSAVNSKQESETDRSARQGVAKTETPDQDREVSRSRRQPRAKVKLDSAERDREPSPSSRQAHPKFNLDSAEQDRDASRTRRSARVKAQPDRAKQDREASRSNTSTPASPTNASSWWNDPGRAQWNGQGQYGRSPSNGQGQYGRSPSNGQGQYGPSPWSWQGQGGQTSYWGRAR